MPYKKKTDEIDYCMPCSAKQEKSTRFCMLCTRKRFMQQSVEAKKYAEIMIDRGERLNRFLDEF